MNSAHPAGARVDWVDYAKGLCIVMVVMMHSTLGVEAAAGHDGWMHALVAFAKPFRIPGFFMISGLFLARTIGRDWRDFLDRKVVHFAYFYLLWATIQFAFKAPGIAAEHGAAAAAGFYLESFIEPFGTLWFIYLLPIFFVASKLTRGIHPAIVWLIAAALAIAPSETGWTVIDEFAGRFVYFYTGYVLASQIFALTKGVQDKPVNGAVLVLLWAVVNGVMVWNGYADWPLVSLALGLIGAAALIRVSALMALYGVLRPLRYCGEHSIVIYLAFFLPMAATRTALIKTGLIADIGTMAVIVTGAGVLGALVLYWAARGTPLKLLFERPARFRLAPKQAALQPAE